MAENIGPKIYRASELRQLDERSLRKDVLIPLFEAMGFKDVKDTHGNDELGKDIVMWKAGDLRDRVNYAVVVKAKKLTTSATGSQEVCRQVRECFASTFVDATTPVRRQVDQVLVVNSHDITSAASTSIEAELQPNGYYQRTTIWDGLKLYQKVREFLTRNLIWDRFEEANQALNSYNKNWEFSTRTDPGGISTVSVSAKHDQAQLKEPIKGKIHFGFPDTPEGKLKRAEYIRHQETGKPIEFTEEFLEGIELPEFLEALSAEGKVDYLRLGSTPIDPPMLWHLEVRNGGGERFFLDYVHFTDQFGGTEEFTLANTRQPISIRIALTFPKDESDNLKNGKVEFDFKGIENSVNVLQHLRWFQLQGVLSRSPATIIFRDTENGFIAMAGTYQANNPDRQHIGRRIQLFEKLLHTQRMSKKGISLSLSGLRDEDVFNADLAFGASTRGRIVFPPGRIVYNVTFNVKPALNEGDNLSLQRSREEFVVDIADTELDLGPAQFFMNLKVRRCFTQYDKTSDVILYSIECFNTTPALICFPRWLTKGRTQYVLEHTLTINEVQEEDPAQDESQALEELAVQPTASS